MNEFNGRVLVCGGRDFKDGKFLYRVLDGIRGIELVISGAARGADRLADQWAETRGVARAIFPANWSGEGKRAGFTRNRRMLDLGDPGLVVAFPGGTGTHMMMRIAREAEVPVRDIELEVLLK